MRIVGRTIVAAVLVAASAQLASASSLDADNSKLFEMLKRLEARVAVLEAENVAMRREMTETRRVPTAAVAVPADRLAGAPVTRSGAASEVSPAPVSAVPWPTEAAGPVTAYAATGQSLSPPKPPGWAGIYFGAAAGGALTNMKVSANGTSSSSGTSIFGPPTQSTSVLSYESGNDIGAGGFIELFLGGNAMITSNLLVGLQAEFALAELDFDTNGLARSVSSDGSVSTYEPNYGLRSRWMASAVGRFGTLIGSNTLLYGVAGWSVAGFESDFVVDNGYLANGPTFGAGLEFKLSDNWSIRGEYRYTTLLPVHITEGWTQTYVSPNSSNVYSQTDNMNFESSLHAARIGIAYTLGR